MKALERRLRRLECRSGPTARPPWERPRWQWLSEAAQEREVEEYLDTRTDSELDALLATIQAQFGETL